jgi:hypothetical protein
MDKNKVFLHILALLVLLLFSQVVVFADEYEKDLGVSKPKNIAKIVRPSDVPTADLKKIKKVAVLLTSTLPLFGEVAEYQLIIKLRDMGFDVTERSKLSDLTQKELMKEEVSGLQEELKISEQQIELEKKLEKEDEKLKEVKRLQNRAKQIVERLEKILDSPQKEILNIVEIGKKLNLDTAIVGTLFEGKRQISFPDDKPPSAMEKIVVSTFYLQMIDIKTEKVVLAIMLEYDKGESITSAIDTVTEIIKDERKRK